MNERIKELAEQAERLAEDELAHLERVHNRLYSFTEGREIYNQKFAELIVRECMEQIDKMRDGFEADNEDQQALGADWAGLAVARHFGVE